MMEYSERAYLCRFAKSYTAGRVEGWYKFGVPSALSWILEQRVACMCFRLLVVFKDI